MFCIVCTDVLYASDSSSASFQDVDLEDCCAGAVFSLRLLFFSLISVGSSKAKCFFFKFCQVLQIYHVEAQKNAPFLWLLYIFPYKHRNELLLFPATSETIVHRDPCIEAQEEWSPKIIFGPFFSA